MDNSYANIYIHFDTNKLMLDSSSVVVIANKAVFDTIVHNLFFFLFIINY